MMGCCFSDSSDKDGEELYLVFYFYLLGFLFFRY